MTPPRGQYERVPKAPKEQQDMIPVQQIQSADPNQLMHLVVGAADINVNFPDGTPLQDLERTLGLAVQGYQRLSGAAEKLKPIIGRILLTVKQRKLWKGYYKNFTAFIQLKAVDQLGFSRASAFDALKIATAFPTLTTEQYARYGGTKLLIAAKVTNQSKPDYQDVLKLAESQTVDTFKATVAQLKTAGPKRARPCVIAIRCDEATFQHWKSLIDGSDILERFQEMVSIYEASPKRKKATIVKPKGKPASTVHQTAEPLAKHA